MPHSLQVDLLGPVRVQVDGAPLDVDTRKALAVLAVVLVDGPTNRDRLADLLWPTSDQPHARGALRRTLSVLRRGLGGRWVEADRTTVSIVGAVDCDLEVVDRGLDLVQDHDHDRSCPDCRALVDELAARHRGPFLEDLGVVDSPTFEDWRDAEDEDRRRRLCRVLDLATGFALADADLDAALAHARRWLVVDPLNEEVHRRVMLLHAWQGQRAEAIRCYRDCVAVLDRELGVTPLGATTAVYRAILADELQPAAAASAGSATVASGGPTSEPAAPADPGPGQGPGVDRSGAGPLPLVGRVDDLARLDALGGDGPALLVVTGEPGIGKTRYVEEHLARRRAAGASVATARCHPDEVELSLGSVAELLADAIGQVPVSRLAAVPGHHRAEVARLVPDLVAGSDGLPPVAPLSSPGAQAGMFAATWEVLARCLEGDEQGIIVIDDAHGIDPASLDLLAWGVRRLRRHGLVVIVVLRSEGPRGPQVQARLADAADDHLRVQLDRLAPADVDELVRAAAGRDLAPELADRVVAESEGLPLLVVEYGRLLRDAGEDEALAGRLAGLMPPSAADLARSRLEGMSETAQQVASTAAAIGRSFALSTVLRASGRTEGEVVDGLEELVSGQLVREVRRSDTHGESDPAPDPAYDFLHAKLRQAVLEQTSLARLRLLHGRIADVLVAAGPGEVPAALVADHLARAGRERDAATWFRAAGDRARTLFANDDALAHYERALALGHPDVVDLQVRIGELQVLRGHYAAALAAFELAAARAAGADLADVEHRIGSVHLRRGEVESARAQLERARALAGDDPLRRARIGADLALAALRDQDLAGARHEAEAARELADAADDVEARVQASNVLGLVARHSGDPLAAGGHFATSAQLAAGLVDPSSRIAALNNLALARGESGDLDEAMELARDALELGRRRGDRHRQAALHNNLADLLHRAGQEDEAMENLRAAVTIFADLEVDREELRPDIWQLVEW